MHKFLSSDNGVDCYRCGTAVDYPWMPEDEHIASGHDPIPQSTQDLMEREIHLLLPSCAGASDNRGHHYTATGAMKDDDEHQIGNIECAYGDAWIGWETDLDYVPRYCKGDQ